MADGALWGDAERARQTVTEVKSLKGWLEPYTPCANAWMRAVS